MSGSNQAPPPPPCEKSTHDCSHRLVHPVLLYQDTSPATRAVQKELQGAGGAKTVRIMPMHLRACKLPLNIVVFEGLVRWPCHCFGVYFILTSTCQKRDVAVGPQLPMVATQQTLAALGCETGMMCLDASSTKLKANLVCCFPAAAPSSSLYRLATIPSVANNTRHELRAHVRVDLQPGVFPKVLCTFSWSKDAGHGGAVARSARSRNQGARWSPSTLSRSTMSL